DLAASFGIHQLARIDAMLKRREQLWAYYQAELRDLPIVLPLPPAPGTRHALHLFTCLVDPARTSVARDEVLMRLHELRIGAGVHYRPAHLLAYYRRAHGGKPGDCPNAESIGARTFSIPFSGALTDDDAADVVRALRAIFG